MVRAGRVIIAAALPTYHHLVRSDVFPLLDQRVGRLLDVGGGVGATSASLKAQGRASEVTLIDQVANEAVEGIDHVIAGDLEDPALIARAGEEAGPFDTILALDVLEHLRDPWAIVRALDQVLAPGGALVISLPNVNYIGLVGPLVLKGRYDLTDAGIMDRTHLRWFARHGVIELATHSGLVLEAVQPNIFGRIKPLANRLSFGLLTRFLALQYVVRVRKPI